jgi:uncharacterized protein YcgL (UPF0745 family)
MSQIMKVISEIYRSPREEGMYLYVKKEEGLARVPEALLARFGKPQPAMVLVLTPERTLARTTVEKVLASLEHQGYYLQLPPPPTSDGEVAQVASHNSKLSG